FWAEARREVLPHGHQSISRSGSVRSEQQRLRAADTLPPSRLAPGQFERNECIVISEAPHWTVLPAVVSVRWEDALKTGSAGSNAAVCGADGRQSETTGLLQEHACLARTMPATNKGRRV